MVEIPGVRRRLGLDSVPDAAAAAERASEGCVAAAATAAAELLAGIPSAR